MTTADAPSITCRTSRVFATTLLPDPELPTTTALWFGRTPDGEVCRCPGKLVDADEGLSLIPKGSPQRRQKTGGNGIGRQLQTAAEWGAAGRDRQRWQQARRCWVHDVKALTSEEAIEPFCCLGSSCKYRVADGNTQRDTAWNELTLSDRCERSRRVGKSDLIIDGVVSFACRVSLHRRATIEHPACNLRFNGNHVEARMTLRAAANEGVNDCASVNHRRELRRRENDLELIADADYARASDRGTPSTDDGVDQQVSDVVTVGDSYREP